MKQTRKLHAKLRELQNASLEGGLQGKFNLPLNKLPRDMESDEFPHFKLFIAIGIVPKIELILNANGSGLL